MPSLPKTQCSRRRAPTSSLALSMRAMVSVLEGRQGSEATAASMSSGFVVWS